MTNLLAGVMLEDCWVLGWAADSGTFSIHIEASLWPGHPAYTTPRPGQWTCYREAHLIFEGVTRIEGLLAQHDVRPQVDPDGSRDYGSIDSLTETDRGFRISGEFGDVTLCARSVQLRLANA